MRAHKAVCRYCNDLIETLADLEIEHIIPESLPQDELAVLLTRLDKKHLDINSFFNWLPVHRSCNNAKRDTVAPDASLHYWLMIAANKVPAVREEEAKFDRQAQANDGLARLARQIELGTISREAAIAFLQGTPLAAASKADPTILGFSINLADATETDPKFDPLGEILMGTGEGNLPGANSSPESLQAQLEDSLKALNALTVKPEPVQNNGETLSIRYAVWLLNLDLLPKKFPNAWRLLEVAPFSEVYPGQDPSTLVDQAIILKRNELIVDPGSDNPLPYRYCPLCASTDLHRGSRTTEAEEIYYIYCGNCTWAEMF
jgi:hypothetical protein